MTQIPRQKEMQRTHRGIEITQTQPQASNQTERQIYRDTKGQNKPIVKSRQVDKDRQKDAATDTRRERHTYIEPNRYT